jgi:hypothetical protein
MANFAGFGSFGGVNIYESLLLTIPVEDWSAVRSPGRARRRRAKHRQNIVTRRDPDPSAYNIGGQLHMHPETARKLRAALHPSHPVSTSNEKEGA